MDPVSTKSALPMQSYFYEINTNSGACPVSEWNSSRSTTCRLPVGVLHQCRIYIALLLRYGKQLILPYIKCGEGRIPDSQLRTEVAPTGKIIPSMALT